MPYRVIHWLHLFAVLKHWINNKVSMGHKNPLNMRGDRVKTNQWIYYRTLTYTFWFMKPCAILTGACCPPTPSHYWFISLFTGISELGSMSICFVFGDKITIIQGGSRTRLICPLCWNNGKLENTILKSFLKTLKW